MSKTIREIKDELHELYPQYHGFIEHTLVATMCNVYHLNQQCNIADVVGRSEQLKCDHQPKSFDKKHTSCKKCGEILQMKP